MANPNLALLIGMAHELMQRGFKQTMADNTPPFRWFWQSMQLDLVPLDEKVLGFANRWYRAGFEAFNDRGNNDVYASHDLEDILTVIEGRAELAEELASSPAALRHHVAACVAKLLHNSDFNNALGGLLSQSNREPLVRARLQQFAQLLDQ